MSSNRTIVSVFPFLRITSSFMQLLQYNKFGCPTWTMFPITKLLIRMGPLRCMSVNVLMERVLKGSSPYR